MLSALPSPRHDINSPSMSPHSQLHNGTRDSVYDHMGDAEDRLCPGCKKSAVNGDGGLVVAFGQSFFHVDCFRCAKCNNHVTADTNLLLLSDGSPICANCSYSCNVCRQPILDEAIMTGDDSYHAHCFKCKVCRNRIDELVFAKTSQGIYCMPCHNERMVKIRRYNQKKAEKEKLEKERAEKAAGGSSSKLGSSSTGPRPSASKPSPQYHTQETSIQGGSPQYSPQNSTFGRSPSKQRSIPYTPDAFTSNAMMPASPSRIEPSTSPRKAPSSPFTPPPPSQPLSVKVALPHTQQAPSSAPLMRPSTFGDVSSTSPLASSMGHALPSPPEKQNTLPVPPNDNDPDALKRRKSYDDGVRPLSQLFKQNNSSLNSKRVLAETPHSPNGLNAPRSPSSKRQSINPGLSFNRDAAEATSPAKSAPTTPSSGSSSFSPSGHRSHSPSNPDSPRIHSPLRLELPEPSSSRSSPLAQSPHRQESFSTVSRQSLSLNSPEKAQQLNEALSISSDTTYSAQNTQTPIQPPLHSSLTVDQVPAYSATPPENGTFANHSSSVDDDGSKTPIVIQKLKTADDESKSRSGRSSNSSLHVKGSRSASRSPPNSPAHRADVPQNVESEGDTEESDAGKTSMEDDAPPLPRKRPSKDLKVTTDVDPDASFLDSEETSDVSEGSAVEERMSHTTFIAPALPPIRFSMTGSDFSELLGAGGSSFKNLERLAKLSESSDQDNTVVVEKVPAQPSPTDEDQTAVQGTPLLHRTTSQGERRVTPNFTPVAAPNVHTLPKRSNTVHAQHVLKHNGTHPPTNQYSPASFSRNRNRSSSDSNQQSNMSNSTQLSPIASDDSHEAPHTSVSSHGGTRVTATETNSAFSRHPKFDTSDLVKRRLQEALADANERGAYELKLDRGFVMAIVSTMEQRHQEYASLKAKFDGMKRTSKQYIDGLSVAQTEFDRELGARRDAEAEITRLRVLLSGQAARLTSLSGEHRRQDLRQKIYKDLSDNLDRLEKDISKLKVERDMTLAEVQELSSSKSATSPSSSPDMPTLQLGRSLVMRLDNIKAQYKNELNPLMQQREALSREIAELRSVRDVFLEETTVLNARNEELAQLSSLYTRRMEASALDTPKREPPLPEHSSFDRVRQQQQSPMPHSVESSNTSDDADHKFPRVSGPETFATPQSKKFIKWPGSKAKDVLTSAVSAMSVPDNGKGKAHREHMFQQISILRFTRCDHCGDKMWGSQLRCSSCNISVHGRCVNHVTAACSQQTSNGRDNAPLPPSMFGRDLTEQVHADSKDGERMVPVIVEKCIEAVEFLALDYEGIYRKSGGSGQCKVITQLFERGDYKAFNLRDNDRFNDICSVTSVLKTYFRMLPVPLLTYNLHDNFIHAAEIKDSSIKAKTLSDLVTRLPAEHYYTLRMLMLHLSRVRQKEEQNKMDARNLGIVFGPTLMRSPDPGAEFSDMGSTAIVIRWLVENAPTIFNQPVPRNG